MIVDWLLYGLIIFGLAKLLNNTVFKTKPASKQAAWILTIVIFLLNLAIWSVIRYYQQETISKILYGFNWKNQFSGICTNAFIFSYLFYKSLSIDQKIEIFKSQKDEYFSANLQNNIHEDDENINENYINNLNIKEDDDIKNFDSNNDINKLPFPLLILVFFAFGAFVALLLSLFF